METLYREVKASERLPSDTTFKVIRDVTTSSKSFIHLVFSEVGGLYTPHVPEYWLEPIQSHHPQPISENIESSLWRCFGFKSGGIPNEEAKSQIQEFMNWYNDQPKSQIDEKKLVKLLLSNGVIMGRFELAKKILRFFNVQREKSPKGEGAQERYEEALQYFGLLMYTHPQFQSTIVEGSRIAAGLPPNPEGGKDE